MHERAHDESLRESRGELVVSRGLRVFSLTLGLTGQCDVVEFRRDDGGVPLNGHSGKWRPYPVEYKRGTAKSNSCDELQLCAQAMCLEEMLCCTVQEGALYYGENRRRTKVIFTDALRDEVRSCAEQMHMLYLRGHTPEVKPSKACNACSMKDICVPKLRKVGSVAEYIRKNSEELA